MGAARAGSDVLIKRLLSWPMPVAHCSRVTVPVSSGRLACGLVLNESCPLERLERTWRRLAAQFYIAPVKTTQCGVPSRRRYSQVTSVAAQSICMTNVHAVAYARGRLCRGKVVSRIHRRPVIHPTQVTAHTLPKPNSGMCKCMPHSARIARAPIHPHPTCLIAFFVCGCGGVADVVIKLTFSDKHYDP